jgi:hypothetical protein
MHILAIEDFIDYHTAKSQPAQATLNSLCYKYIKTELFRTSYLLRAARSQNHHP